jgi:hypothetical protein
MGFIVLGVIVGGGAAGWFVWDRYLLVRSLQRATDRSPSPIGPVTYKQQYAITLRSLEPRP